METVTDRRRLLKIKLKSLACEARIIRKEEGRSRGWLRKEMHNHRVVVVRMEARATLLAYGIIRGKTVEQMEPKVRDPFLQKRALKLAEKMCKKYGPPEWKDVDWKLAA